MGSLARMRAGIVRTLYLLAPFMILAPGQHAVAEPLLWLNVNTPDIKITARTDDNKAIRLPKLPFSFHIEAQCPAGQMPKSMLLSVADTRKRISAARLGDDNATIVSIVIPARQVAPLSIANFCLNDEQSKSNERDQLTVSGALSAQAALLCGDRDEEHMIYSSLALDVTLHCIHDNQPSGKQ